MIGSEVKYWIYWYDSILCDLKATKLGKRLRGSLNGYNGAVVTKNWINATQHRLAQLMNQLPKDARRLQEMRNKKNGEVSE